MISIIWFAICDGLIAFAPSFTMILVLRTLFGFGMGAEWTSGTALAMENWPKRSRGIASGILQGSWALGYLAVGPVAAFVVPSWGWRTLFLIAAAPAVLVLFIRFAVPESEEWTKAKAVKRSEGSLSSAFTLSRGVLPRLVWGCFAMAAGLGVYYALTGLYPTMLKTQLGFSEGGVGRLVVLFNLGMLVGSITTGWLASKRGSALAIAVPALLAIPLIPLYVGASDVGAIAGGLFGVGFCGVTPLLLTELFPAEERARLIGIAYHVGSALAAFIPMGIAALAEYAHLRLSTAIAIVAIACEVIIAALVLGRRFTQRGRRAPEPALASAE
jgi:SHS family lactate transporter-like MFS transporter